MDTVMLDDLVDIVKNDINNDNKYKDFDKLLNTLSKDEVEYFIENCGDRIFGNDNLSLILWNTHPKLFNDYITDFIDNKLKKIDYDLAKLELDHNTGVITHDEFVNLSKDYLNAKKQIVNLKNGFVSNIVNFIKK